VLLFGGILAFRYTQAHAIKEPSILCNKKYLGCETKSIEFCSENNQTNYKIATSCANLANDYFDSKFNYKASCLGNKSPNESIYDFSEFCAKVTCSNETINC
ncbi:MAG: hypothetical protein WCK29_01260, partial [archaeon]